MRKGAQPKGKVLLRCSLCGKFHAAYQVEDEKLGTLKLCYACWRRRTQPVPDTQPD